MRFSTFCGFDSDKQTYCILFYPVLSVYKVDTHIRGYVVTEFPRIHLFLEVALKWQGILQLSPIIDFLTNLHESTW